MSHMRIEWSCDAENTCVVSASPSNATAMTAPVWPWRLTSGFTVTASGAAVRRRLRFGCPSSSSLLDSSDEARSAPWAPMSSPSSLRVDQTHTVASQDPDAKFVPDG
eukprot:Amastigsp_a344272_19.p5 type:complete len:107 gc:universal Amastigsp_a344272_19:992-672(-)